MEYKSRAANGLRAPRIVLPISSSAGIFVHWTAGPSSQSVRQIQDFHMDSRGWSDIAYSWLVQQDGTINEGRGWGRAGAHTEGFNTTHHAVCAILGPGEHPTVLMLNSLRTVIEEHFRRYGTRNVRPHGAVGQTACPGPDLTPWAEHYSPEVELRPMTEAERRTVKQLSRASAAERRLLRLKVPLQRGRDVRELQTALGLPVTGTYGPGTARAVRKLKRQANAFGYGFVDDFKVTKGVWELVLFKYIAHGFGLEA